jgi:hypothetical protein
VRLTDVLAAEAHARWRADFERTEKRRDEAAAKFARLCPELLAGLVGLFREADAADQECLRVNATAPANEPRRLVGVELTARNLTAYSSTQPSISATIRLPDYDHSDHMAWPVQRPNDFAVAVAESMRAPRDVRHTSDWWRAAEADAPNANSWPSAAPPNNTPPTPPPAPNTNAPCSKIRRNVNAARRKHGGVRSKQLSGEFSMVLIAGFSWSALALVSGASGSPACLSPRGRGPVGGDRQQHRPFAARYSGVRGGQDYPCGRPSC